MKRFIGVLLVLASVSTTHAATSVTRHAITWTFDTDYETGTFVNGDPWVKEHSAGAGIVITGITPGPTSGPGGDANGTMVNPPVSGFAPQGYDARGTSYDASLNLVSNGASDLPLSISANSSVISTQSYNLSNADQERPVVGDASVLTVLAAGVTPDANDFRPPYVGTDKSLNWNTGDIVWSRLPSLASPPQVSLIPAIASILPKTERLWLLNSHTGNGRDIHPKNNMNEYGRDLSNVLEESLLRSLLDDSQADKEQLVLQVIQIGLDIAACIKAGMVYSANGGHNQGMKMPMLYAGWLLNDADIIEMADKEKYFVFQEDQQTFYVAQSDVDDCPKNEDYGRTHDCYTADMIGMPEWGIKHSKDTQYDGSNWSAIYRDVSGTATVGHCLTAILMGLEDEWNWPPFFDYYRTRYYPLNGPMSYFEKAMWITYHDYEYTSVIGSGASAAAVTALPGLSTNPVTGAAFSAWLRTNAGYRIFDASGRESAFTGPGLYYCSTINEGQYMAGRVLVVR